MTPSTKFDVVVVGAGVFGSWTANFLQRAGKRVLLLDAYAPGNSRRVPAASRGLFAWAMAQMKFIRAGRCARCRFGSNCRSASALRFFTGPACFGLRRPATNI